MATSNRAKPCKWGKKPRYGEFEIVGGGEEKPRILGEGSFGKTFEAVRTDSVAGGVIEEHVAIKVLNPDLLITQSRRFQVIQELVALTKFKHSNLIHYIRCGEEEGEVYYAMELCRGGDLARLVRRYQVLPEKVVALIGLQVATGLREVHQRHQLVHRDIKPSNIMLVDELAPNLDVRQLADRLEEQEGLCRIVDFGLVSFALNSKDSHQKFVGSPMYASPEQINEQALDGQSDIYSLGMTLWFLVQGKGPLLDATGNELKGAREAMRRHSRPEEHEPNLPPHLSPEFRRILAKMLAKRPEDRFASAAEVLQALRDYLRAGSSAVESKFTATRLDKPLADVFDLEERLSSRSPNPSHVARRKDTGERVKLTILPGAVGLPETETLVGQLCELAELVRQPTKPGTLLSVREVILASDVLAFTEDWYPHLSLAAIVKARAAAGRPIPFNEAMAQLHPIAQALDFMIEHGHAVASLRGEDIWLTGAAPPLGGAALDPLTALTDLHAHFSVMGLPRARAAEVDASMEETLSASFQVSSAVLHPVPAFARLVYYLLNGSEVPTAAQYTPAAYTPTPNLKPSSNEMIRDLISRHGGWTHATTALRDLCAHEGIAWQQPPLAVSTQRGTTSATHSRSDAGSNTAQPSTNVASGTGSESWSSEMGGGERVCEIVAPGVVFSPYDPERRRQDVPADQWVPSGRITCQFTQRLFRLPRKLDLLRARVISPGIVQSPYAAPDVPQVVPWPEWVAGGEIVCAESGRRITLPHGLPTPEGLLVQHSPGTVLSPYDRVTSIAVPVLRWEPGASIQCPVTRMYFLLPKELPPLEALADAGRPGMLATPYSPSVTWQIEPLAWMAGGEVKCPVSGKPLRLPSLVERWPAEARVVDVSRRLISNPFVSEATLEVPATMWSPKAPVTCPQTSRTVLLPADLPLLTGELVEGQPGAVRSPFTGEIVFLAPKDWLGGVTVTCPQTNMRFQLPAQLPEWIPVVNIAGLPTGCVRSPYGSSPQIPVPADQWTPGQILQCPETGRSFRLPLELPLLEGQVTQGRPGIVGSPFSGESQEVSLEDWNEGQRLECQKTGRTFLLPAVLPEWLADGQWVAGYPGRILSPFHPHPEIDLAPEQWRPKQLINCPATGRRFRVPITESFPSLALEKEAVQYALAEPESTEVTAAETLKRRHRTATADLVKAIWERHDLETVEKRRRNMLIAEIVSGEPGVVQSPYGSRPRIEITPALWAEPEASALCPETGRRYLLPVSRPSLIAGLVPGDLGRVISPYNPNESFRISPDQWQAGQSIRCPHSGQLLQLPSALPPWLPEGTLKEDQPGLVFSPYGRCGAVRITGPNWFGGAPVTCLETGRVFVLPVNLPPLTAAVEEGKLGRIVSPYARNQHIRVPHRLWRPGAPLICPATKRVFRLPETLPVWNRRPFPWKPIAAVAAGVVVIVTGWVALPHLSGLFAHSNVPVDQGGQGQSTVAANTTGRSGSRDGKGSDSSPQSGRVVFAGGLEIEDWPQKKEPPKGLSLIYKGRELPLEMKNNQFVVTLPTDVIEEPGGDMQLRLPGWKPLKLDLPARAEEKLFDTQSTPMLPLAAELNSSDQNIVTVPDRKRLERQRFSLPSTIIPDAGTDYTYLEASWVGRLSQEPDAVPPPVNPVRLPIVKGQIERPLPTGIYDFTLRGGVSDKVEVTPYIWKAGVPMASQMGTFATLPPSLAGDFVGLLFTVVDRDRRLGYFFSVGMTPKLASIKALVNPLPIKGGEVIGSYSVKPELDELGVIENVKLTAPDTLQFDASLRMFDYRWTLKSEEGGTRFMYGQLIEFKTANFDREKVRLEQMFQDKARTAKVSSSAVAERLSRIPADQYRVFYTENLKEAKQKAQYLRQAYPDMKVKESSIYFGLHSTAEVVRVVPLKNGDWDLQKDAR